MRTRCEWFWFSFSLVEKLARDSHANHNRVIAIGIRLKSAEIGNLMLIFRRLSLVWSCTALLILKSTSKML